MKSYNWIILKSTAFESQSVKVGRALSYNDLKDKTFVDYCFSHNELKSLASFYVVSKLGAPPGCSDSILRKHNQSNKYYYELLVGNIPVGAVIVFCEGDYYSSCIDFGIKLSKIINLSEMQESTIDHKTQVVVSLTALGLNTKEISKLLYLTSRGVEYHIEKAKRRLGANNKANLVFKANQYGWI